MAIVQWGSWATKRPILSCSATAWPTAENLLQPLKRNGLFLNLGSTVQRNEAKWAQNLINKPKMLAKRTLIQMDPINPKRKEAGTTIQTWNRHPKIKEALTIQTAAKEKKQKTVTTPTKTATEKLGTKVVGATVTQTSLLRGENKRPIVIPHREKGLLQRVIVMMISLKATPDEQLLHPQATIVRREKRCKALMMNPS